MKPIEPGCLAIELPGPKTDLNVYTVHVIRKTAPYNEDYFCTSCGSDPWYLCHWEVTGSVALNACESRLVRIDGFDHDAEEATSLQDEWCNEQPRHALDA